MPYALGWRGFEMLNFHGARTVQVSLMIVFISWPRAIRSIASFPAHWPMRDCLVEVVALFKVSWCVPTPLSPCCVAQADRASAGCRSWCSTVSAARFAGSREGGGVVTQG